MPRAPRWAWPPSPPSAGCCCAARSEAREVRGARAAHGRAGVREGAAGRGERAARGGVPTVRAGAGRAVPGTGARAGRTVPACKEADVTPGSGHRSTDRFPHFQALLFSQLPVLAQRRS
ncbi:Eukaryotic translation initiation factor 4B [Streptomyces misionensis JCM 4497]